LVLFLIHYEGVAGKGPMSSTAALAANARAEKRPGSGVGPQAMETEHTESVDPVLVNRDGEGVHCSDQMRTFGKSPDLSTIEYDQQSMLIW
jgi:hypothetical protein